MAAKIGVLDHHQTSASQPARYVKRVVADYLVRKQQAIRITKFLIQLIALSEFRQKEPIPVIVYRTFGPDELDGGPILPPREPFGLLLSYPCKDQRTCA